MIANFLPKHSGNGVYYAALSSEPSATKLRFRNVKLALRALKRSRIHCRSGQSPIGLLDQIILVTSNGHKAFEVS